MFLLLMAMCKNFYTAILYEIGKVFSNIKPKHRLKKFIYRFISVPAKWGRTARTHVLRLFTDRPYDRLNISVTLFRGKRTFTFFLTDKVPTLTLILQRCLSPSLAHIISSTRFTTTLLTNAPRYSYHHAQTYAPIS